MEDKFVIIAEYMNSIEAELARQTLEDFQIPAIIVGANAGDARIGVFETVKLQVKQSNVEQAMQILEDQEQGPEPEEYEVMDESGENDEDEPYEPEEQ
jgi:hypothetical protein